MSKSSAVAWQVEPNDEGRRRAALRVKQRRKSDSRRWTVDGRRRSSRSSKRPSNTSSIRHATPWNERFIFEDTEAKISTQVTRKSHTALSGKENLAIDSRPKTTPNARNNLTERHFTERADGELVLNFSRREIIAPAAASSSNAMSPLLGGSRDVSVSPFDMEKLKLALLQADVDFGLPNESAATDESHIPLKIHRHEVSANLEAFEELLYEIELEEELAHRELADQKQSYQQSCAGTTDETDSGINSPNDEMSEPCVFPRGREDEIREYVWYSFRAACERERRLVNDGMKFHEVVEM